MHKFKNCKEGYVCLLLASCEMLSFVKVLVSGFRTPFTLHQAPETLFLNGGNKIICVLEKKKKKNHKKNKISFLVSKFNYSSC